MQVETTEINGFLIDKFNQYGLEEGKKQGICPICSHTRKPKNQNHVKAVDNLRRTTNATKEQLARMFNQINQYA